MPTTRKTVKVVAMKIDKSTEDGSGNILAATTLGVGVEYRLYGIPTHHNDGWRTEYVVVEWPMSGPMGAVQQALGAVRDGIAFIPASSESYDQWEAWDEASSYIQRQASMDLLKEWTA